MFVRGVNLYHYATDWTDATFGPWLDRLAARGVDWVCLNPIWFQANATATTIALSGSYSPTNGTLTTFIQSLKARGFRVILKPLMNCTNGDPQQTIGTGFNAGQWTSWFSSYSTMISGYATLAESTGVDALVVETELTATEGQTASWQALITTVRGLYSGAVTAAPQHTAYASVAWWASCDWIGLTAYWPVAVAGNPTLSECKASLATRRTELSNFSAANSNKPIMICEYGYPAMTGGAVTPWVYALGAGEYNETEQATCYQAWAETWLESDDWLIGALAWDVKPGYSFPISTQNAHPVWGRSAEAKYLVGVASEAWHGYQRLQYTPGSLTGTQQTKMLAAIRAYGRQVSPYPSARSHAKARAAQDWIIELTAKEAPSATDWANALYAAVGVTRAAMTTNLVVSTATGATWDAMRQYAIAQGW